MINSTWRRGLRVSRSFVFGCWRRLSCCCRSLLLLLLRLLVVQLDGQRDRPPPQPHQEDLNLIVGLGLLLPPHRVVGKHSPVVAGGHTGFVTKGNIYWYLVEHKSIRREATNRRHLRKPVEFKMLLRPILLHVARYSEYISDRDTEPSAFVSKCAFSLLEKQWLLWQ